MKGTLEDFLPSQASKPVENPTIRAWLEKFGLPEGDDARCLRMDSLNKGELGKETVDADKKLAPLQN